MINKNNIEPSEYNRLASSIMQVNDCDYLQALDELEKLRLVLKCNEKIRYSIPLQAAFITAVNSGIRAFLGGVYYILPDDVKCLLPWHSNVSTLNDLAIELGGVEVADLECSGFELTFGFSNENEFDSLRVLANSWQGGIINEHGPEGFAEIGNLPIGGVAAGSLAVCLAFLRVTGIKIDAGVCDQGVSIWRPDLNWLDPLAFGPEVNYLPKKYWVLGLGHLGQGYIWCASLLPYKDPQEAEFLLQDFDRIEKGNLGAALLSEICDIYNYKTRVCANWLEARRFTTRITERKFNELTKPDMDEPLVALCGFDNASSRMHLESIGFDLVVEVGLGAGLESFDNIILHTFPGGDKSPTEIWKDVSDIPKVNPYILSKFADDNLECGILAETIAGKAISTSFVGAFAGAMAIGELVRSVNSGLRYNAVYVQLRAIENNESLSHESGYSTEAARNGFVQSNLD